MTKEIDRDDVLYVADYLCITPISEEQINEVLEEYDAEAEQDPTATWNLIVENILYRDK